MIQTRYLTLTDQIEQDIRSGQWHKKLPGVVALSRHYAVAPATVVKAVGVLSERGLVTTQGTRGTFISAAGGKRPVFSTLGVVGISPQSRSDRFRASQILAYEAMAERRGFGLLHLQLPVGARQIEFLHRLPVDGLIFTYSTLTPELVLALRQEGLPFVLAGRLEVVPGVDWVDFDNEQGLGLCLDHLIALGHERIAWISFRYVYPEHQTRMDAFFEQRVPAFDPALRVAESDYLSYWRRHDDAAMAQYGQDMMRQLLALPEPPTAVVCHSEGIAQGVCQVLEAEGLRVPQDLSLAMLTADIHRLPEPPTLAHAHVCSERRMQLALEHLMERTVRTDLPSLRTVLPYAFSPGHSTAPPDPRSRLAMGGVGRLASR